MRKMHNEVPGDAHEALQESLEIQVWTKSQKKDVKKDCGYG